jgi:hypothetical protein
MAQSGSDLVPVQLNGKGGFKIKWEHVTMAVLCGAAVVSSGMLFMQWKQAAVGRRVSTNVIEFLKQYGSTVNGRTISGGVLLAPLNVDEAVVSTVDFFLTDVARKSAAHQQQQQQQQQTHEMQPEGKSHSPPMPMQAQQQQQQQQSGPPVFPEPVISGKTGKPISREVTVEDGQVTGGGYPSEGASGDDFSYVPIMPPGMSPPGNMS